MQHSGNFCMHSGTFWNILQAFWNILEHSVSILKHSAYILKHSAYILEHSAYILEHSGTFWNIQTDRQTYIRTCWVASSQLKGCTLMHGWPGIYLLSWLKWTGMATSLKPGSIQAKQLVITCCMYKILFVLPIKTVN